MTSGFRSRRAFLPVLLLLLASGKASVLAQQEAESMSTSFRKAAERVLPSVVAIRMAPGIGGTTLRPAFPRGPWSVLEGTGSFPGRGMMGGMPGGSGFVIDAQRGLILTTASNVDGASQVWVVLADGREATTTRVILDPRSDLAVLSIDPKSGLTSQAEWGASEALQLGDWVLSIARPTGTTWAVSAGIVSGIEPAQSGPMNGEQELIRSDVKLAASGSGGPLINLAGQVVGINRVGPAVGPRYDDFNAAIPSAHARRVVSELVEHGRVRRGYLGLSVGAGGFIAPNQPSGLIVSGVSPSSPAVEAGFQIGDRIVSIDGRAVTELDSLARAVDSAPIGQEFRVEVERGGKRTELNVKSRPRPEPGGVIGPGPVIPGPRAPDRRLRPRRNPPVRSEGPDEQPDLSSPPPGTESPKAVEPLKERGQS